MIIARITPIAMAEGLRWMLMGRRRGDFAGAKDADFLFLRSLTLTISTTPSHWRGFEDLPRTQQMFCFNIAGSFRAKSLLAKFICNQPVAAISYRSAPDRANVLSSGRYEASPAKTCLPIRLHHLGCCSSVERAGFARSTLCSAGQRA